MVAYQHGCYVQSGESRRIDGGKGELGQRANDDPVNASNGVDGDSADSRPSRSRSKRYRMSTGLVGLGSDFLVLNGAGEHVLRINGSTIAKEDTIVVEDLEGRLLYRSPAHRARTTQRLSIFDAGGNEVCAVVRLPHSPLRDRFEIDLEDEPALRIEGNPVSHEFSIVGPDGEIAVVSQRWFRAKGSYGIEIAPNHPDALLITSVVALDLMVRGLSST